MKNEKPQTVYKSGIGFTGMLGICFIVLKLTGFINWSWWWVLSPLWIPPVFLIVLFLVIAIIAALLD